MPINTPLNDDLLKQQISLTNELNDILGKMVAKVKEIGDEKNFSGFGKILKEFKEGEDKLASLNQQIQDQKSSLQQSGTAAADLARKIDEGVKARTKLTEISRDLAEAQSTYNAKILAGTAEDRDLDRVQSLQQQLTRLDLQAEAYKDILSGNDAVLNSLNDTLKAEVKKYILLKNQGEQAEVYVENRRKEYELLNTILDDEQKKAAIEAYELELAKQKVEEIKKESSAYQGVLKIKEQLNKFNLFEKLSISAIVEKAFELDQLYTNNAKQLGVSKDFTESIAQSTSMTAAAEGSIAASGNTIVQSQKNILAAQNELNAELGTANFFSKERLQDQVSLVKEMGIEAGTAAKIQNLSMLSGATNRQILDSVNNRVIASRNESKINLDNRKILDEVAKVSGQLSAQYKNNPELLAKAVVQAKELGLTLQQTAGMADKLLNFESSIESELKAELLTGRALNLEQARYLALTGDSAGAAKELMNNVGGLEEFQRLNVIQQRSLAEAIGMSADELTNSLKTQEVLKKMGVEDEKALNQMRQEAIAQGKEAEFLEEMRRRGTSEDMIAQQQQLGAQEKMNLLVDKMLEVFSNLAEPLTNMVDAFTNLLGKGEAFRKLMMVIGGIMVGKMLFSATATVAQLVTANAALVAQRGIQTTLTSLAGRKAATEGAAAAFSMGPLWPIGIAAIGGILAALGISALTGGSFSGGGENVDKSTAGNAAGGTNTPPRPSTPQSQPPIVVHSYLQSNGQTIQQWQDTTNMNSSTNKFA